MSVQVSKAEASEKGAPLSNATERFVVLPGQVVRRGIDDAILDAANVDHVGRDVCDRGRTNQAQVHLHLVLEDLNGPFDALRSVRRVRVCVSNKSASHVREACEGIDGQMNGRPIPTPFAPSATALSTSTARRTPPSTLRSKVRRSSDCFIGAESERTRLRNRS